MRIDPEDCDASGHVSHAGFQRLFERARWDALAAGPALAALRRASATPVVRRATIEYLAPASPGDELRFDLRITRVGTTSFTARQTAHRNGDDRLLAVAEFVLVCLDDEGATVIPEELRALAGNDTRTDGALRIGVHGVELAVELQGEGPAILFIHGYPLSRAIWEHQVAHLDGTRRINPDLRGFGGSDAPDLGYSMATWADDLAALLDALGVERAVLCGLSMGGYIAFEFVRRYRQRVAGLILVDTRAGADAEEGRKGRDAAIQVARDKGPGAIADQMLPKLFAPASLAGLPQVVGQVEAAIRGTPVPGIVGALAAMRDRPDSRPLLPTLSDIPTLVIVGAEDKITPPSEARVMAEAIPGASLREIPGAGHLAPVEKPELVTAAIRGFLESRVLGRT